MSDGNWNEEINALIRECASMHRKGDVVTESDVGGVHVTTIDAMPPLPEDPERHTLIDVHFFVADIHGVEGETKKRLGELLARYPEPERLAAGPSYIELGGVLGDQGQALLLLALGQACGFWDVITPETLGVSGDRANEMAGSGFVMCSGFKETAHSD